MVALKLGEAVSALLGLNLLSAATPKLKPMGGAAAGAAAGAAGTEGRTGACAGAAPKVNCPGGVADPGCAPDCVGPAVEQHMCDVTWCMEGCACCK